MRAAFGFLTVLGGARRPTGSTFQWFPVVGLVVGGLVGGAWWLAEELWPPLLAAVLVVAVDLALTGLLHVDGLADTTDGLVVHDADPERRLAIMRAPDVGAYGAAVVAVVLMARVAGLASIEPEPLLVAGLWTASRSFVALVPLVVPYARQEGLAAPFLEGRARLGPTVGLIVGGTLCAVALGGPGLAAGAGLVVAAVLVTVAARRRLGGFTGDVLGACAVVGETVGLLVAGARW
ncbi:MAG TPA: adenosylcobinamide-GDP ribazoletransferase [Acidimicrobiales bacterium]|nr:adenosylcobinamide-GDP ribazoletransferase [Acidimicrobiales bacterium]